MRTRLLIGVALCGVAGAPAAWARQDPAPPPSGIVIHLFGPDSVMSNVAPALAGPPPPKAGLGAAPAVEPAASSPDPSLGGVLHQMFVTGDPNDPPKPSKGKTGNPLLD